MLLLTQLGQCLGLCRRDVVLSKTLDVVSITGCPKRKKILINLRKNMHRKHFENLAASIEINHNLVDLNVTHYTNLYIFRFCIK